MLRGERPRPLVWVGMAVSVAALVYLLLPSLVAPPLAGAALMAVAGAAWGAYSLIGRGSHSPLADTAGNFLRCAPVGIVLIAIGLAGQRPSAIGMAYGIVSGAVASGLGYIIWYQALPSLTRTRAALVQLTVPAIAALGGVLFIAEPFTLRLLVATAGMIGGVALALLASRSRVAGVRAR
ncbi:MAG: DMT family transporter [Ottowia sp.]|nr:DMT family transporter [Ottowia sp.]